MRTFVLLLCTFPLIACGAESGDDLASGSGAAAGGSGAAAAGSGGQGQAGTSPTGGSGGAPSGGGSSSGGGAAQGGSGGAPSGGAPATVCEPGKQEACACPGSAVTGAQSCKADGSGWGACEGCPGGQGGAGGEAAGGSSGGAGGEQGGGGGAAGGACGAAACTPGVCGVIDDCGQAVACETCAERETCQPAWQGNPGTCYLLCGSRAGGSADKACADSFPQHPYAWGCGIPTNPPQVVEGCVHSGGWSSVWCCKNKE